MVRDLKTVKLSLLSNSFSRSPPSNFTFRPALGGFLLTLPFSLYCNTAAAALQNPAPPVMPIISMCHIVDEGWYMTVTCHVRTLFITQCEWRELFPLSAFQKGPASLRYFIPGAKWINADEMAGGGDNGSAVGECIGEWTLRVEDHTPSAQEHSLVSFKK